MLHERQTEVTQLVSYRKRYAFHALLTDYWLQLVRLVLRRAVAPELDETLGKAFIAALLLTRSVEHAETAVLKAISLLEFNDEPRQAILSRTVGAAIEMSHKLPASAEEPAHRSKLTPLLSLQPTGHF
jgi:hypothetical protein